MARSEPPAATCSRTIVDECIAVRLRLLNRAVSRLYNRALRPFGVTVSQMNILVAVSYAGPCRQQAVCEALHIEKSTLSRDVEGMRARGWVEGDTGTGERMGRLAVSAAGRKLIDRIMPAWREAQKQATAMIGEAEVAAIARAAGRLGRTR